MLALSNRQARGFSISDKMSHMGQAPARAGGGLLGAKFGRVAVRLGSL